MLEKSKNSGNGPVDEGSKGIIQRVLDTVFEMYISRDLDSTCDVKISFLEIYNDTVTDLLEDE